MTITNKLKTIAKTQINNIIQRIPVSDLRSILASRGVLIFESERESHLHSLSVLHNKLDRHFGAYDVENWHADESDMSAFEFDAYLTASLNLVDDLWIPGEEPPPVQLPELDDAVQAWNAQHGTELLTIDESELSELQDKALKWDNMLPSALAEDEQEHNDLRSKLAFLERHNEQISHNLDRAYNRNEEWEKVIAGLRKELAFTEERLGHAVDYQGKLIGDAIGYADKCGDLEQERDVLKVQKKLLQEEVDALKAQLADHSLTIDEISKKLGEAQLMCTTLAH